MDTLKEISQVAMRRGSSVTVYVLDKHTLTNSGTSCMDDKIRCVKQFLLCEQFFSKGELEFYENYELPKCS